MSRLQAASSTTLSKPKRPAIVWKFQSRFDDGSIVEAHEGVSEFDAFQVLFWEEHAVVLGQQTAFEGDGDVAAQRRRNEIYIKRGQCRVASPFGFEAQTCGADKRDGCRQTAERFMRSEGLISVRVGEERTAGGILHAFDKA